MKKIRKYVPVVQQIEAAECGAASLCMVLAFYGRYEELSDMRVACKISRDGTTLKNIIDAAESYGMTAKAYRTHIKNFCKLQFPLILFWENRHYLVLESLTDKSALICDPKNGRRKISRNELEEGYSGIVIAAKPGENFTPGGKPYSQSKEIFSLISKKTSPLIYLSIIVFILNLAELIIPMMTSVFVDTYLPSINYVNTFDFLFAFFLVLVIQFILLLTHKRTMLRFEQILSLDIHHKIIGKLMKLPFDYFQSRGHSSLLSRICSISTLSRFLSVYFIPLILGLLFSVIDIILMFRFSNIIGFVVLSIIVAVVFLMVILTIATNQDNLRSANLQIAFTANVLQSFNLFDTIKASALEEQMAENSMDAYVDYQNSIQKAKSRETLLKAIPTGIPLIIQALTIVIGCSLIISGEMTLGSTLACQSIAMSVFSPIASFINGFESFQKQDANVRGLHDIEHEKADPIFEQEGKIQQWEIDKIELKSVCFSYNTSSEQILQDISFTAEKGKSVALVGNSGSGKSTLLRLIEGLYQPLCGEVLYNGKNITEAGRASVNSCVAGVSQNTYVFSGTIAENITLFDPSVSENAIIKALKDACIYEDVIDRKNGIYEEINSCNTGFSGGQIQRFMIARALVRNPKVLILDEATSALDTIVEEKIMKNILSRNITVIIVAHRLSTIRDCDEILVLEQGHIIERGTHEALLLQENSRYSQLFRSGDVKK